MPTPDKAKAGAGKRTVPRVLIVEDDASFASRLARNLQLENFECQIAGDCASALRVLDLESFDVIVADIRLPDGSGLDLIDEIQKIGAGSDVAPPPIVMLSSIGDIETVVSAMRRGALDYLTKESSREEIALRLRNTLRQGRLDKEVRRLRRSLHRFQDFDEIVGASQSIQDLKETIAEVAPSSITVLITGETGVGKELVARGIHRASDRAAGPFIEINCAALPDENLFLSELFGHEKGAFTGAIARKKGHFEMADGGTLFLDEIGELGPMAQARLLRAVETQQFNRVGGERPVRAHCRLIFATNKKLDQEVKEGSFRQDLYYRINICPIQVPPLRSHPEDIPILAQYFASCMSAKHRLAEVELSSGALETLKANPWPGNVRELRNVIERLTIRFAGKSVEGADLNELNLSPGESANGAIILPEGGVDLAEVEKSLVLQALQRSGWSQRKAANLLGISVDRMNARVKKYGVTHPSWRVHKS